ncbi:MAG TPA: hypothetical protein VFZ75_02425 [Actinomycetota bacterium]|nr:hypothetical protein [Actinomycetota bacterium]
MARTAELERGFRRAGLPTFIRGYSARRAFAKALPLLTFVFVLEILNALNLEFGFWVNVGFLAGGIALALGVFGLLNVARGQRFLEPPRRIGLPEMAVFVLVPTALPLLFGGQWMSAAVTMLANAALLGAVYLVLGFGALSLVAWAGRRFLSLFTASLSVLVRALSLLLFFLLVIFFTTETWQIWTVPGVPLFVAAAGLFLLLAAGFLLLRLPGSVRDLERDAAVQGEDLSRPQRVNVALVVFLSQFLQVLFVAAAVWLFFVVFGALLVSGGVREAWLGDPGTTVWRIPFFGDSVVVVTVELLRVATGMACFAALYYAVATQLDAAYRDEVVEQLGEQLRETFARRAEYLSLLRATAPASGPGPRAEASPPAPA